MSCRNKHFDSKNSDVSIQARALNELSSFCAWHLGFRTERTKGLMKMEHAACKPKTARE